MSTSSQLLFKRRSNRNRYSLKKASKAHAGQAKTLSKIIKKK